MPPVSATPLAPIANKESLIERFGDWIEGLFHKSETVYNTLTEEEKKAGVWASGVVAVINANLDALPPSVIAIIQQKFPDLSLDVIHGFLDEVRDKVDNLNSEIPLTLEDAIAWAQKYLAQHTGDHSAWAIITTGVVNLLSILFSPGTAVEKFIAAGLTIYQQIVKPHVEGSAVPAPSSAPATTLAPAQPKTTETAQTPDKDLIEAQAKANAPLSDYHQKNAGAPPVPTTPLTEEQQAAIDAPNAEAAKPGMEAGPDTGESGQYKDNKAGLPANDPNSPQFDAEAAPAAPLTPGTPEFEAAVEAEVQKRLAKGNG